MMIRRALIYALAALSLLALPLQCIIDPSVENISVACVVLASGLSMLLYIGCTETLNTQPLSSFALLGFCVTSQLGALLVQTYTWTPVRSSLYDPLYTFGTLAFYQAIAIGVHATYRFFSVQKAGGIHIVRGVLNWAGVYRTPPCIALWMMGFVGMASHAVFINTSLQMSVIGKFGMGFNFLAWAPFLIPYYHRQFGDAYCSWKITRLLLIGYGFMMGAVGLAMNARGVMLTGIATVVLLYFLVGLRSTAKVSVGSMRWICGILVSAAVFGGPITNLVSAMAIARGLGPVPMSVKLDRTLWVFRHPEVIAAWRDSQDSLSHAAYNEHYIANPILARFVLTKFHDNSLHFASMITSEDSLERLRDVTAGFLWGVLPAPALQLLGVNVAKTDLNFSIGDYLPYLAEGQPLGGHRVGSMFGHGLALFGMLFPFVYAAMCLIFFYLMDLLTIRYADKAAMVSALGFLQIWNYFLSGLSYESLHGAFYYMARNFWQILLIYVTLLAIARIFSSQSLPGGAPMETAASRPAMSPIQRNPAAQI